MHHGILGSVNLDVFNDQLLFTRDKAIFPEPEVVHWTEAEILHLHDCILEDAIRNLFCENSSLETTTEIYKWLSDIEDKNAFSFNICCLAIGFDPDQIRNSVQFEFNQARIRKCNFH
jgi:hypothetical protein